MLATSTAKHPSGVEIVFEESSHIYTSTINGKEIKYISGTGFLNKWFPEFDPTGSIAKRCAEREGITVEALKARWAAKGRESCRLGTRCHETIEDCLLCRDFRNSPENDVEKARFKNAIDMATKFKARLDILGVEKIVFSPELQIAGTIDFFARSRKDGTYIIIDHKTNEKIERDNQYNKFCLAPIDHLPDIALYHYGLQLNTYEYLLKREKYVPRDAKFRLFLNHVLPEKAELIELPDLQSEVKDLVIDYLRGKWEEAEKTATLF